MKAVEIALALLAGSLLAACDAGNPRAGTTNAVDPQMAQLFRLTAAPATEVEDSLFILWEYGGALRERELAAAVLAKTEDPEIRSLAQLVRDGHQAGMNAMKGPAAELGLTLPAEPTALEKQTIAAAAALPAKRLDGYFLRRQRAMHAWDVTVFDDYRFAAVNPRLKAYVESTRSPLRAHSALVDRLAKAKGAAE